MKYSQKEMYNLYLILFLSQLSLDFFAGQWWHISEVCETAQKERYLMLLVIMTYLLKDVLCAYVSVWLKSSLSDF